MTQPTPDPIALMQAMLDRAVQTRDALRSQTQSAQTDVDMLRDAISQWRTIRQNQASRLAALQAEFDAYKAANPPAPSQVRT